MRRILVRAAVSVMLLGGTTFAYAFSTGPPVTRTNGFPVADKPAESNCTLCHMGGTVNGDPNGYVRIVGLPAQYTPSAIYPLEVHLFYDWTKDPLWPNALLGPPKWGFQLTSVVASSGDSAGSFLRLNVPPDSLQIMRYPAVSTSKFKARAYLEHTIGDYHWGQNPDGLGGDIVWHFNWQAPPADSGKLYFFVAGNAANGDSCSICGGDHIFASVDSTVGGGTVSVDPPHAGNFTTSFERPYPNPMTQCLNLQYEISQAGMVDLAVFDLAGRKVRTLRHEHAEPSSYGEFWNGRNDSGIQMKNGVYYIRLLAPGLSKPISYRVTLAR
jgi:hypothetical protein